jgi:hypothetical protein
MMLARRVILVLLLVAGFGAAAAPALPMRHVAKGLISDPATGNAFLVLHTPDDLANALNQTSSRPHADSMADALRAIDFDAEIVIGVMLSNRRDGCAGVDITDITQDGIVSVVHYRQHRPARRGACQDTLYAPFDFVAVAKTNAPFRFTDDTAP